MTGVWIAVAAGVLLLGALASRLVRERRHRRVRASILELEDATSVDAQTGAVRSVQKADLAIDRDALDQLWTPVNLERLARTYWRFLTRVTLGLIRVHYTEQGRSIVLIAPPFRLLSFQPPEYEIDAGRGLVRWRIERGLLVSRRGRGGHGYLQIEVRRDGAGPPDRERLHVEVEVANFYPSIASRLGRTFYNVTQSRIHVIITYAFLRSLARLDLAESRVGSFLPEPPGDQPSGDLPSE